MSMRLVGQVMSKDNKEVVGFRVHDLATGKCVPISTPVLKEGLKKGGVVDNAKLVDGELRGTEASLKNLPVFDFGGNLISSNKIAVLRVVVSPRRKLKIYEVQDAYGRISRLKEYHLLKYISLNKVSNVKAVKRKTGVTVSGILKPIPKHDTDIEGSTFKPPNTSHLFNMN